MSLNEFERLLERYYAGNCTPEEEEWVTRWLAESTLHPSNPWHDLSEEQRQRYVDQLYMDIVHTTRGASIEPSIAPKRRVRRMAWLGGVAASICLLTVAYLWIPKDDADTGASSWEVAAAAAGEKKKLQLADGTMVWLQGGSELHYPADFGKEERQVRLDGEAYFDVAHQAERPFIVRAGDMETEVLGTAFNIEAFAALDRKTVSLIEGSIAVRVRDHAGVQQGSEIVLSPMEAVVFHTATNELARSDLPVFGTAEDFKAGNIQFDETPLDEVLFRLEAAYGVEIHVDQMLASQHKITGDFLTSESIDDVIRSIARTAGAHYQRDGRSITITF